jgi:2-dehydro-3-deoxy-D-gluconate 5-dehydrogenase
MGGTRTLVRPATRFWRRAARHFIFPRIWRIQSCAQLSSKKQFRNLAPLILVNNAGTIRRAPAAEYPAEFWNELIAVNLTAVFHLSQLAARHMLERDIGGKIVNIASLLSFQGGILVPGYAAAKGGVAQLTKALANEWAAKGINVNAIAPGYMATDNTTALRNDPVRSRQILDRIPAARWGEPGDIAGAAIFLCSSASDYVHGHVLAVDGGWLGR